MKIKQTRQHKGLELTIHVVAYDNGMIEVDGAPINDGPPFDQGPCWLGAAEISVATLSEFRRQVEKRHKSQTD